MNRLHIADFSRADHPIDLQITIRGLGSSDAIRFVGQLQIMRTSIGFAEYRDRLDPQFPASADNPQSNLTAIGHENSFEHRREKGFGVQGSGFRNWKSGGRSRSVAV